MKVTTTLLSTLLFAIILAACGTSAESASELTGRTWQLQTINGQPPQPDASITLNLEDGQVGGSSGCNTYGGEYDLSGTGLSFRSMVMTEMACMEPDGVMELERTYLQTLQNTARYRLTDNTLELLDESGSVILVYTAQPPAPDASLKGTDWTLTGFVDGEAVSSTIAGTSITARFEDGVLRGNAGCNDYGAPYEIADNELTIIEIEAQAQDCSTPAGIMQQEMDFMRILNDVTDYEIDGSQLTLSTSGDRALLFSAQNQ